MHLNNKIIGAGLMVTAIILIILLSAVKADIDERDAFLCQTFHETGQDMQTCPAHASKTSWYITTAFGIAFIILGGGIAIISDQYRKPEMRSFNSIDTSILNEEEQQIYKLLTEHEGSMYQSDLIKQTGFSKVQMTRVLDKLEHNHIIERKRRGMTNIVVVK